MKSVDQIGNGRKQGCKDVRRASLEGFLQRTECGRFFFEPSVAPFEETQLKLYFLECRLMIRAGNNYQAPNKLLQYFERVYHKEVREFNPVTACKHISKRLTQQTESLPPDHRCQVPSF